MQSSTPHLDWIDSQSPLMLKLLREWADINSWSENIAGLSLLTNAMKPSFAKLDGAMSEIDLPLRNTINTDGKAIAVPQGKALRIIKRPMSAVRVFLGGHMDTVFPPGHPFQQTAMINSNMLLGPGVADMKGGLIVLLKALEAFEQHPFAHRIGWEIMINPDEEVGSNGSGQLLWECAQRNAVGLIFEPSFSDGAIVSERKGSANFTIAVRGRSAHAGRDFHRGRNAIIALARTIIAIDMLNDNETGMTINVGHISGGGPVNIVPDFSICKLNIRTVRPEDFTCIHAKLQELVHEASEDGIELSLHVDHDRPPKPFDEKNRALFDLLKHCATEEGYELSCRPSGGACDGNLLSQAGLPIIDSLGVIGGGIHTSEEYVLLDSLTSRARLVCLFLIKLAAGEFSDRISMMRIDNPQQSRRTVNDQF